MVKMTQNRLLSLKRNWGTGLFFVALTYVGICAGSAWYGKKAARKMLQKVGLQDSQIDAQYLPFPAITIHFQNFEYKKLSLHGMAHFAPYFPGIFSGHPLKMLLKTTCKGEDLEGSYQESTHISPLTLYRSVRSLAPAASKLMKFEKFLYVLRGVQAVHGTSQGSARFKTYQATLAGKVEASGDRSMHCELHNGAERICEFSLSGAHERQGRDTRFHLKSSIGINSDCLNMANTLSRCITGKEMLTAWLLENQSRIQELFLPFTFSIDFTGKCPTDKFVLLSDPLAISKTLGAERTSRLKFLAEIPLDILVKATTSITQNASAESTLSIQQSLEKDGKNKIACDVNVEWGKLLAHFAKRSPESYKNAEKLFGFILQLINQNTTLDRIKTHAHAIYDTKTLSVDDFSVNDMSFSQLLQAFFSNPAMHQHLK